MRYLAVFILALLVGIGAIYCSSGSSSGGGDDDSSGDDTVDDDATDDDDASSNTWTDSSSGLTWQVTPLNDWMTWENAKSYCDNLGLDGHDDWRLPTISELRSLIRGCEATMAGGACGVTDDCLVSGCSNDLCGGCEYLAGPGSDGAYWPDGVSGEIGFYWSSSPIADTDLYSWSVGFDNGAVGNGDFYGIGADSGARCLRVNDDADDDADDDFDDDDNNNPGDTWTDSTSGLTWQVLPSSSDWLNSEEAIHYCWNLDFDGHEYWSLPTISELRSLIRGCEATELGGICGVTDGCAEWDCQNEPCGGCEYLAGPGSDGAYWPDGISGEIGFYWSSSQISDVGTDGYTWLIDFEYGYVAPRAADTGGVRMRCVLRP